MSATVDMLWVETRKAIRARMPLWTGLGSLFMPAGFALLILLAKHPELTAKLGLIGAKANLTTYASASWSTYLPLTSEIVAAGGFVLYVLAASWVFGREFADGTVKDLLAVPIPRRSILAAKFILLAIWSAGLTILMECASLALGGLLRLPGGSARIFLGNFGIAAVTGLMVIAVGLPFAWVASLGRGYLLPVGMAILTAAATNLIAVIGMGPYFPWAIPGLYSQGQVQTPASFVVIILTGLVGVAITYRWWMTADQNR